MEPRLFLGDRVKPHLLEMEKNKKLARKTFGFMSPSNKILMTLDFTFFSYKI